MEDNRNFFVKLFDQPDHTAEMGKEDINQNRVMGILSYIGILVLVPIFAANNSKFSRFHANQGLILLITEAALSVVRWIFGRIGRIGMLFRIACIPVNIAIWVALIACTAFEVFGIVYAAKGTAKELPLVNKFKILK